jgi:Ca2+-binding RTX toxin-like protein
MGLSTLSDFQVNTTTANSQLRPSVTELSDGRLFYVWASERTNFNEDYEIRGQIRNADGSASGGEFVVNAGNAPDDVQFAPHAVTLTDGRVLVTWDISDGVDSNILGRLYNANGTATGTTNFVVNDVTTGLQSGNIVARLANGGYVAAWEAPGNPANIKAIIFSANGTPGTEFTVNTTAAAVLAATSVTQLNNGNIVFSWKGSGTSDFNIRAQIFTTSRDKVGTELTLNTTGRTNGDLQEASSIQALTDGGFFAAWVSNEGATAKVRGQFFTAAGGKNGTELLISSPAGTLDRTPSVAVLDDGRVFVAWRSFSANQENIKARVYNTDGTPAGIDFVVNSTTAGNQTNPTITILPNGRVSVAWQSEGEIRSTVINPLVYNGDGSNDNWSGGAFAEQLTGSSGSDVLKGNGGNDAITGGDGGDDLYGGIGIDKIFGGTGNDELFGDSSGDYLYGEDGTDTLSGGSSNDVLNGGAGADTLIGDTGSDWASYSTAIAGVKAYLSAPGSNTGDALGDTYTSIENLSGSKFSDALAGNSSANKLKGGGGKDTLSGGSGNDVLNGGTSADKLSGGKGTDYASYADAKAGVKAYLSKPSSNRGEATGDTYSSIEALVGSKFTDTLTGNAGTNTINGAGGNDLLSGGSGNDFLQGGTGKDRMSGGSGADKFYYGSKIEAGDTITSFSSADYFVFKGSAFGISKKGPLSSSAFWANKTGLAHDTSDRFILETDTGKLFYDSNGSASGGTKLLIADVDGTFTMSSADILIV